MESNLSRKNDFEGMKEDVRRSNTAFWGNGEEQIRDACVGLEGKLKRNCEFNDAERIVKRGRVCGDIEEDEDIDARIASTGIRPPAPAPGQEGIAWVRGMTTKETTFLEDLVEGERAARGNPSGYSWLGTLVKRDTFDRRETAIVQRGHEYSNRLALYINPPRAGWLIRLEKVLIRIRLSPDVPLLRALSNILYTLHMTCMMTEESSHCAMVTMHFAGMLARELTRSPTAKENQSGKERFAHGSRTAPF